MIGIILLAGAAVVGVGAAVRGISDVTRRLVCWTVASLTLGLSAVVFFGNSGGFSIDGDSLWAGAAGFGVFAALFAAAELLAPSKRLQKREKPDYDSRAAERALDLVLIITVCVLSGAAAAAEFFGEEYITGICIVPAASFSARQLSYFLWLSKTDSLREKTPDQRRAELLNSLHTGKRGL